MTAIVPAVIAQLGSGLLVLWQVEQLRWLPAEVAMAEVAMAEVATACLGQALPPAMVAEDMVAMVLAACGAATSLPRDALAAHVWGAPSLPLAPVPPLKAVRAVDVWGAAGSLLEEPRLTMATRVDA